MEGDDFDLQELSKSLTSPELCVIKEDQYYLKSINFNQLKNDGEVKSKAEEIVSLIKGATKVILDAKPITIKKVIEIKDNGKRVGYVYGSLSISIKSRCRGILSSDGKVQEFQQPDPILTWIKVAQTNENVAEVFRRISKLSYNWGNFYNIWEIIVNDSGGTSNIKEKKWATQNSITRFERTAQSPAVIGDLARHGVQKQDPPENPMSLREAKRFIESVLHNWLRPKTERS